MSEKKDPEVTSEIKKKITEEWWTQTSPKHRIQIPQRDDAGKVVVDEKKRPMATYVKFDRSRIDLDLSVQGDLNISKGLHESGHEGIDIFVIEEGDATSKVPEKVKIAFSKKLRELASDDTGLGIDKIMGLFSMKELRTMGVSLNRPKDFVDILVYKALETKVLAQLK